MSSRWIKIHNSIEEWEWIDNPVMFYFWVRLLILANWEDKRWHGKVIQRGSFVTTVAGLASMLKLSVKQVRTCLERLKKGKEISISTANNYTHITICKYDDYQYVAANEVQIKGKCEDKERATTQEEYNTSDTKVSSYSIQEEKKEDTKVSPPKKPSVPYDDVLKLWNGTMKKVPKIRSLTQARKDKIKLRVSEMGGWDEAVRTLTLCFQKIEESDFCNGSTGRWMASFDWFFENDKNWLKVYEGNYDNRTAKTPLEDLQEKIAKADAYFDKRYGYADTTPGGVPTGGWFDSPDEQ